MWNKTVGRWALALVTLLAVFGMQAPSVALAQDGSARDQPVAFGETAEVGSYELTVLDIDTDAAEFILDENTFNEPPDDGNVFVMVRLGVAFTGDASGTPSFDLGFQAVGALNLGYSIFGNTCGAIPEDVYLQSEMFEGGEAEFNICWQVPENDADTLLMYVDDNVNFDAPPVWFSLGLDNESTSTGSGKMTGAKAPVIDESSRNDAVPLASAGQIGDYVVTVVDVLPDAGEVIIAENSFNEEPTQGNQFYMVTVEVTYTGSEIGAPWLDLNFQAVGDESVSYVEFEDFCGLIPKSGLSVGDVFPTGTATFNVCWQISSEDAGSLVMFIDPLGSFDDEDRMWFSLDD